MIPFFLYTLLWIWDNVSLPSTSLWNTTKYQAEEAYRLEEYEQAAIYYRQIVDASFFSDPAGRMNMANAYYKAGRKDLALENYQLLTRVRDPQLASRAYVQLAQLAVGEQDTLEALAGLRKAILLDPENRVGVANFEVLRYHYSGTGLPEENPENPSGEATEKPQEVPAAPAAPGEGLLAEKTAQREQLLQNLDRMNMSEEQALSILEAMKVNEMQYIYQFRKLGDKAHNQPNAKVEW